MCCKHCGHCSLKTLNFVASSGLLPKFVRMLAASANDKTKPAHEAAGKTHYNGKVFHMIKQFEINPLVKKQLQAYLDERSIDLKTAMDDENSNHEVAAIVHDGLPAMVKKIYSLEKMQTFFWEKKDLMVEFVATRLAATGKKSKGSKNTNQKKR